MYARACGDCLRACFVVWQEGRPPASSRRVYAPKLLLYLQTKLIMRLDDIC